MPKKKADFSRRDFLRTAGAVGLGSMLSPVESLSSAKEKSDQDESQLKVVPTRPFGKTGVNVPILGFGTGQDLRSKLLLLRQAVNMGVTYWDTATGYAGGNSEIGIGKYFEKYPEDRKKVFLVTKSHLRQTIGWDWHLKDSLERMNTEYIDLFLIHGISNIDNLFPFEKTKAWVKKAKSEEKIRFFGFSAHRNMEENLMEAAKLGWIDGIMLSYNFRIMNTDKMKRAVDECSDAGIGLIAMKTQGSGWLGRNERITPNEKEQTLFNQLKNQGLTIEQAKLKTVWNDSRISSICSFMNNMAVLMANVSAATDNQKLLNQNINLLEQHAQETAANYCAGCASICESEINNEVPISDVMRYLMYSRCYGEPERAKSAFTRMPSKVRKILVDMDYKKAERKCPQRMQIGRLMHEAAAELA
ncbi:MAG: aldo/keto reductase [Nitrospinales bacterium]